MQLKIESDYKTKILHIEFENPVIISSHEGVLEWRAQWLKALQSWHSPYKALINCKNLTIDQSNGASIEKALETMMKLLKGFFLKKVVGFNYSKNSGHDLLPFEVLPDESSASETLGIRQRVAKKPGDLRSTLVFDNHFRQSTIELVPSSEINFDSAEKISVLKDKLTNNLMLWHSSWNLLIDCSKITFDKKVYADFERMEKFFGGFFLKKIVGYEAKEKKDLYPFPVYRVRHRAASVISGGELTSGDEANCKSRKSP